MGLSIRSLLSAARPASLLALVLIALHAWPQEVRAQLPAGSLGNLDLNRNGVIDVLLIGNSQFGFVPDPPMAARSLKELADAQGVRMLVDLAQVGGVGCDGYWTYRNPWHWMEPQPQAASGDYDVVLLQPGINEAVYTQHSGDFTCWDNFRNLVEGRGIRFALFGTLDVQSGFVAGTDNMDQVNLQYAQAHNLLYVPAGRIIRKTVGSAPTNATLNELYQADHQHPSSEAEYVYVMALFRALAQVAVTGITYVPPSLGIGATTDASGSVTALTADEALLYQQTVDAVLGGGSGVAGSGGVAGSPAPGGTGGFAGGGSGGAGGSGAAGSGGGTGAAGSGGSAPAVVLSNGVAITSLSDANTTGQKLFTFAVPTEATSVTITLTAGTGNADLYVRRGAEPTLSTWDCRPYLASGTNETCTLTNSGAATYYVMVYARSAYSAATLTATYQLPAPPDGVTELANGGAVRRISGAQGSMQYWKMSNVPARSTLTISVSGFSGNADLYVRQGSQPTLSSYTCRPYLGSGRAETCQISVPVRGTYYILLNGRTSYTNATLRGSY